jgi:hypothetical protein
VMSLRKFKADWFECDGRNAVFSFDSVGIGSLSTEGGGGEGDDNRNELTISWGSWPISFGSFT